MLIQIIGTLKISQRTDSTNTNLTIFIVTTIDSSISESVDQHRCREFPFHTECQVSQIGVSIYAPSSRLLENPF